MEEIIIDSILLMLPAGAANMAPVLFKWTNFLNLSVDLGYKFRNKRIFGNNKTYRGFFFGTLVSILVACLIAISTNNSYINEENFVLMGFLLGFGALFGDLIESFFKRQLDIASGDSFIPFDQIDWIIGALIFASCKIVIPSDVIITSIVLFGLLHPICNLIGYYLGIKKNKL